MPKGQKATFSKNTGKQVTTKNGVHIRLLNPAQKGRRYAVELHSGANVYTGEKLTKTQKAHRSGYLKARSDSAKAFNYNKRKKRNK